METLGSRIKLARIGAGYARQEDLANRVGLSKATISAIERDDRVPSMNALVRIAGALGRSVGELVNSEQAKLVRVYTGVDRSNIGEMVMEETPFPHGWPRSRGTPSEAIEARRELMASLDRLSDSDIEEILAIVRVKNAKRNG